MRSLNRTQSNQSADRAPSRWAWRVERLMLTPLFRFFLRAGVPMILAFAAGTWWFAQQEHRDQLVQQLSAWKKSFETRPEFMVQMMSVDGVDDELAQEIRAQVVLDFPISSFDLDLEKIRSGVVALAPIKTATARIRPGGVLQIEALPREPAAIWRSRRGLELLDMEGVQIASLSYRMERADLPLVAGTGASRHIAEALRIHSAAAPLGPRLRGVVRIGDRRWDVVLDRNQRILLPEENPVQALERVIALDGIEDILARDIARVDMRIGRRPTLKMSSYASEQWWEIRQTSGR